MKQVFLGNHNGTPSNSATNYIGVIGATRVGDSSAAFNTTENLTEVIVPCAGTFRNFKVEMGVAPGSGKSWVWTVRKNGADTTLTTTISDAEVKDKDTSNSFTVVAGDRVCLQVVPSGTPSTAVPTEWSIEFEGNTPNQNFIGGVDNNAATTGIRYALPVYGGNGFRIGESVLDGQLLIPHSTTIKAFYVIIGTTPGGAATRIFSLSKNTVEENSTKITIANPNTSGNVTGLSVALVAGDLLSFRSDVTGVPAASGRVQWGILLESAVDGESILSITNTSSLNNVDTNYNWISGTFNSGFTTTEAAKRTEGGPTAFTLKNMHIRITTAPGAGTSRVFRLRKNGASGNLVATIADAAVLGSDTTHTDDIVENDTIAYQHVPNGSPPSGTGDISMGMTMYIAPVSTFTPLRNKPILQAINRAGTY